MGLHSGTNYNINYLYYYFKIIVVALGYGNLAWCIFDSFELTSPTELVKNLYSAVTDKGLRRVTRSTFYLIQTRWNQLVSFNSFNKLIAV